VLHQHDTHAEHITGPGGGQLAPDRGGRLHNAFIAAEPTGPLGAHVDAHGGNAPLQEPGHRGAQPGLASEFVQLADIAVSQVHQW